MTMKLDKITCYLCGTLNKYHEDDLFKKFNYGHNEWMHYLTCRRCGEDILIVDDGLPFHRGSHLTEREKDDCKKIDDFHHNKAMIKCDKCGGLTKYYASLMRKHIIRCTHCHKFIPLSGDIPFHDDSHPIDNGPKELHPDSLLYRQNVEELNVTDDDISPKSWESLTYACRVKLCEKMFKEMKCPQCGVYIDKETGEKHRVAILNNVKCESIEVAEIEIPDEQAKHDARNRKYKESLVDVYISPAIGHELYDLVIDFVNVEDKFVKLNRVTYNQLSDLTRILVQIMRNYPFEGESHNE